MIFEALIALGAIGSIGFVMAGLFGTGIIAESKRWPGRLTVSGARASDSPFSSEAVDFMLMAQADAYDDELGLKPGTSDDAFKGASIVFFDGLDGIRELPHDRGKSGRALRPNALVLEIAHIPGDKLMNTALGYECWRRLRRYHRHDDWDANNRSTSSERWPDNWFDAQRAASALVKG